MTVFTYLQIVSIIVNLFMLFVVGRYRFRSIFGQAFVLILIVLNSWAFGQLMIFFASTAEEAHRWAIVTIFSSELSGLFLFHFVLLFRFRKSLFTSFPFILLYIPTLIATFFTITTNTMVVDISPAYWGTKVTYGWMYTIHSSYVGALGLFSFLLGLFFLRNISSQYKRQLILVLLGYSVPIVGGILTEVVAPMAGMIVVPLTTILSTVTALLISYAMFRYQLFEINPATVMQTIFTTMRDAIFVCDPTGLIVMVNSAAITIAGYSEQALLQKDISTFIADQNGERQNFGLLSQKVNTQEMFFTLFNNLQQKIPVSITISVITDEQQKTKGYTIVVRDMTQMNVLISELHKSQQELTNKLHDIEQMNAMMVGRETKMLELKNRIQELEHKASV